MLDIQPMHRIVQNYRLVFIIFSFMLEGFVQRLSDGRFINLHHEIHSGLDSYQEEFGCINERRNKASFCQKARAVNKLNLFELRYINGF